MLDGHDRASLEAQVSLVVLSDLANQTLEAVSSEEQGESVRCRLGSRVERPGLSE